MYSLTLYAPNVFNRKDKAIVCTHPNVVGVIRKMDFTVFVHCYDASFLLHRFLVLEVIKWLDKCNSPLILSAWIGSQCRCLPSRL